MREDYYQEVWSDDQVAARWNTHLVLHRRLLHPLYITSVFVMPLAFLIILRTFLSIHFITYNYLFKLHFILLLLLIIIIIKHIYIYMKTKNWRLFFNDKISTIKFNVTNLSIKFVTLKFPISCITACKINEFKSKSAYYILYERLFLLL